MRSHLVRLSLLSVLVVSVAYQVRVPSEIRLGSFLSSAPFLEDFHDAEEGYRWTRTRSCLTFPDPGPRGTGTIELELSGFRPRGQPPPMAVLEVGAESHRIETPRRFETISVPATAAGVFSTDVELCVRSETFSPGAMDQRALGIRIGRARYIPARAGLPPLGPIAFGLVLSLSLFSALGRAGIARAGVIAGLTVLALGGGYLVARPWTALLAAPLAGIAVLGWGWARLLPASLAFVLELASACALALRRGLSEAVSFRGLAIALFAIASTAVAFMLRPSLVVDIGSGLDAPLVHRFGPPDGEAGVTFRRTLSGAEVDLRDFGGGTTWRISLTAASEPGPSWSTSTRVEDVPFGWRSGPRVELSSPALRVDRIDIDRAWSLPSGRALAFVGATAWILLAAAGAAGLRLIESLVFASGLVLLEGIALYVDPVGFVPAVGVLLVVALLSLAGAAMGGGALEMASRRGLDFDIELAPRILVVVMVGFLVWTTAMTYPLYSGRHFVYHSNIAEEIWKGKFLVFYLPHPDNILSREAQWGGLVVPYSCLYHTLVAPLTALPGAWFQLAHKLFQAALLGVMALVGSVLAWRFAGSKAGLAASVFAVALVSSFQLLGLAHFLTVFGCAMSSLALGYVVLFLERLSERRIWWAAVGLTSVAFLSYTASLLFTAIALAAALPFVYRVDRRIARHLASATLAATVIAFFAYYVHWVLPFMRESIPILLASGEQTGEPFPLLARIAAIPRKLDYSFGSVLIPLAGLAGLGLVGRRGTVGRFVLLSWAGIVVVFSGLDLLFNFILKHHYFVMVPVAAGAGILVARIAESGRLPARVLAYGLLAFALVLGVQAAHALATGTIQ